MTHRLLAVILMLIVLWQVTQNPNYSQYQWMILPLCIGYLSHIVGDALTPSGVPLFYPLKRTYSLKLFKTNSTFEFVLVSAVTLLFVALGGVGEEAYNHTLKEIEQNLRF